jgi:hypothetical protein
VNVVCLSPRDRELLMARFAEHGNSHRRMRGALAEAGVAVGRLDALRRLERRFSIDLGSLCHRWSRRDHADTHPIERFVVNYVTGTRQHGTGDAELWVLLDRVAEIRELMEGRLVGEPGF